MCGAVTEVKRRRRYLNGNPHFDLAILSIASPNRVPFWIAWRAVFQFLIKDDPQILCFLSWKYHYPIHRDGGFCFHVSIPREVDEDVLWCFELHSVFSSRVFCIGKQTFEFRCISICCESFDSVSNIIYEAEREVFWVGVRVGDIKEVGGAENLKYWGEWGSLWDACKGREAGGLCHVKCDASWPVVEEAFNLSDDILWDSSLPEIVA